MYAYACIPVSVNHLVGYPVGTAIGGVFSVGDAKAVEVVGQGGMPEDELIPLCVISRLPEGQEDVKVYAIFNLVCRGRG